MSLRRRLIPESERNRYLAASVTDPDWMDEVVRVDGSFGYFDDPEPRMGLPTWFQRVPWLTRAATIERYVLGSSSS